MWFNRSLSRRKMTEGSYTFFWKTVMVLLCYDGVICLHWYLTLDSICHSTEWGFQPFQRGLVQPLISPTAHSLFMYIGECWLDDDCAGTGKLAAAEVTTTERSLKKASEKKKKQHVSAVDIVFIICHCTANRQPCRAHYKGLTLDHGRGERFEGRHLLASP